MGYNSRVDKLPMVVYNPKLLQAEGNAGGRGSDSEAQTAENCTSVPLPKTSKGGMDIS
jgi:hypothetical protein